MCQSVLHCEEDPREVQPTRKDYFYLLVSPCGWLALLFLGHSEADHDYREAWRRNLLNLRQAGNREKGLESVPPVTDLQLDPAPKVATNSVLKVAPPPGVQVISASTRVAFQSQTITEGHLHELWALLLSRCGLQVCLHMLSSEGGVLVFNRIVHSLLHKVIIVHSRMKSRG